MLSAQHQKKHKIFEAAVPCKRFDVLFDQNQQGKDQMKAFCLHPRTDSSEEVEPLMVVVVVVVVGHGQAKLLFIDCCRALSQ